MAKVYVVLCGDLDSNPEEVEILGVFRNRDSAYSFRNINYAGPSGETELEDDEEGPDLNSPTIDDGHYFWSVQEQELR